MDITEFKAKIKGSLASPSRFRVTIPNIVVDGESARTISILCNQAQMPGRYFQTSDRFTNGPPSKVASASIYDEMVLSFYCQEGMGIYGLFNDWQSYIQNTRSHNEFSYFDDYVSDITIDQITAKGSVSYSVTLIDAYPRMVSPLQLDWSSQNSFHNLQVSMVYRYWRKTKDNSGPFSKYLNVSSIFPNFDLNGALEETGVAIFDNFGTTLQTRIGQSIRFQKSLDESENTAQNIETDNIA